MNFELTNEQKDIQKLARDFAEKELLPQVRERDESGEFPLEAFRKLGKTGIYGLPYPKELGGMGGSYLSYILAVEEISKVDAAFGIAFSVDTSLYGGSIMNSSAPDEIKKKFLAPITYGEKIGSFGLTEHSAGSDAAGQHTVATKDGDSYVINGSKCFNTNGPLADYTVIYCLTDPELGTKGMAAFVVEKGTPGFTVGHVESKMGIRTAMVSDMILDNVRVPAENMIAKPGEGFKLAMKTLDGGRIGVGAQGLGIAEGAYEIARRSRGTPRIANRMLRRVRDFAQVKADGVITKDVADQALCALEIDHLGLDPIDRRMLGAVIENYGGGPVGLETLAATIGEEAVTLEDVYEPYLMQLGFLTRTPRGRCVTAKAYQHLHKPIPGGMTADPPDMDQLTL